MFKDFAAYTALADQKIIDAFGNIHESLFDAERLFSHVLNAQHIWSSRILGSDIRYEVWQEHDKEQFKIIFEDNIRLINLCLSTRQNEEIVTYKNSRGQAFQNSVADMLMQMFNHSTYHRGQIVSLLKKSGIEPPATDYILFKRNNLL